MKKIPTILISMLLASSTFGKEPMPADSISKIQLCLILDVSGSMDGLLSQAQNEIWKTISFIETFQKAAKLGNGTYANIDQNLGIDAFKTPYDHTLIKLIIATIFPTVLRFWKSLLSLPWLE